MTLSSLSFFFFFLSPPNSASQFTFFLLFFFFFLSPELPPLPFSCFFFFFPFFLFCHFLHAFPSFFFFSPFTLLLCLFFSLPRPLPLRSAVNVEFGLAMEFSLADEAIAVEISDSDLPLYFFPSVVDSM